MRMHAVLAAIVASAAGAQGPREQVTVAGMPLEVRNDEAAAIDRALKFGLVREPVARGDDLTREQVWDLFRESDGVRHCYERGLSSRPTLHGRVALRVVVDSSGRVNRSELDDPDEVPEALRGRVKPSPKRPPDPGALTDATVTGCVVEEVRKLVFPKRAPGRATLIRYTYLFRLER